MKKIMLLLVAGVLGFSLWFFLRDGGKSHQQEVSTAPAAAMVKYVVPSMPQAVLEFRASITYVPAREWASDRELMQTMADALGMIASLDDHPALQNQDDIEVRALAKEYRSKAMRIIILNGKLGENVIFGYSCTTDFFTAGSLYVEPALMAVTLQHEIVHKIYCEREIKRRDLPREELTDEMLGDLCQTEAPADAAGSRMFFALWEKGLIPRQVHKHHSLSDPATLSIDAWITLLLGYEQYCRGLRRLYAGREDLLLQH